MDSSSSSNVYVAKVLTSSITAEQQQSRTDVVSNVSTIGSDDRSRQLQADSLTNIQTIGGGQAQNDVSVDFRDSLDGSFTGDSDNDDDARSDLSGSSTSTDSLVERSRKYLTDEAGIIILKQRKLPKQKQNFDLILNFDVDGSNKKATQLKIEQAGAAAGAGAGQQYSGGVIKDSDFNWKTLVHGNEANNDSTQKMNNNSNNSLGAQINRMDSISRIVGDAARTSSLNDKENSYRKNLNNFNAGGNSTLNASAGGLPFLKVVAPNDGLTTVGNEEFEYEENLDEEGKLVLYITEKQLLQLLRQRAVIVPNKKKLIYDQKKVVLVDHSDGSVNQTVVWQQQQQQQQQQSSSSGQQQQQQQSTVSGAGATGGSYDFVQTTTTTSGRKSPYEKVDVFVKTSDSHQVPLPNILSQDNFGTSTKYYDYLSDYNNTQQQQQQATSSTTTAATTQDQTLYGAGYQDAYRPSVTINETRQTVVSPSEIITKLQEQDIKRQYDSAYSYTVPGYSTTTTAVDQQQAYTYIDAPAATTTTYVDSTYTPAADVYTYNNQQTTIQGTYALPTTDLTTTGSVAFTIPQQGAGTSISTSYQLPSSAYGSSQDYTSGQQQQQQQSSYTYTTQQPSSTSSTDVYIKGKQAVRGNTGLSYVVKDLGAGIETIPRQATLSSGGGDYYLPGTIITKSQADLRDEKAAVKVLSDIIRNIQTNTDTNDPSRINWETVVRTIEEQPRVIPVLNDFIDKLKQEIQYTDNTGLVARHQEITLEDIQKGNFKVLNDLIDDLKAYDGKVRRASITAFRRTPSPRSITIIDGQNDNNASRQAVINALQKLKDNKQQWEDVSISTQYGGPSGGQQGRVVERRELRGDDESLRTLLSLADDLRQGSKSDVSRIVIEVKDKDGNVTRYEVSRSQANPAEALREIVELIRQRGGSPLSINVEIIRSPISGSSQTHSLVESNRDRQVLRNDEESLRTLSSYADAFAPGSKSDVSRVVVEVRDKDGRVQRYEVNRDQANASAAIREIVEAIRQRGGSPLTISVDVSRSSAGRLSPLTRSLVEGRRDRQALRNDDESLRTLLSYADDLKPGSRSDISRVVVEVRDKDGRVQRYEVGRDNPNAAVALREIVESIRQRSNTPLEINVEIIRSSLGSPAQSTRSLIERQELRADDESFRTLLNIADDFRSGRGDISKIIVEVKDRNGQVQRFEISRDQPNAGQLLRDVIENIKQRGDSALEINVDIVHAPLAGANTLSTVGVDLSRSSSSKVERQELRGDDINSSDYLRNLASQFSPSKGGDISRLVFDVKDKNGQSTRYEASREQVNANEVLSDVIDKVKRSSPSLVNVEILRTSSSDRGSSNIRIESSDPDANRKIDQVIQDLQNANNQWHVRAEVGQRSNVENPLQTVRVEVIKGDEASNNALLNLYNDIKTNRDHYNQIHVDTLSVPDVNNNNQWSSHLELTQIDLQNKNYSQLDRILQDLRSPSGTIRRASFVAYRPSTTSPTVQHHQARSSDEKQSLIDTLERLKNQRDGLSSINVDFQAPAYVRRQLTNDENSFSVLANLADELKPGSRSDLAQVVVEVRDNEGKVHRFDVRRDQANAADSLRDVIQFIRQRGGSSPLTVNVDIVRSPSLVEGKRERLELRGDEESLRTLLRYADDFAPGSRSDVSRVVVEVRDKDGRVQRYEVNRDQSNPSAAIREIVELIRQRGSSPLTINVDVERSSSVGGGYLYQSPSSRSLVESRRERKSLRGADDESFRTILSLADDLRPGKSDVSKVVIEVRDRDGRVQTYEVSRDNANPAAALREIVEAIRRRGDSAADISVEIVHSQDKRVPAILDFSDTEGSHSKFNQIIDQLRRGDISQLALDYIDHTGKPVHQEFTRDSIASLTSLIDSFKKSSRPPSRVQITPSYSLVSSFQPPLVRTQVKRDDSRFFGSLIDELRPGSKSDISHINVEVKDNDGKITRYEVSRTQLNPAEAMKEIYDIIRLRSTSPSQINVDVVRVPSERRFSTIKILSSDPDYVRKIDNVIQQIRNADAASTQVSVDVHQHTGRPVSPFRFTVNRGGSLDTLETLVHDVRRQSTPYARIDIDTTTSSSQLQQQQYNPGSTWTQWSSSSSGQQITKSTGEKWTQVNALGFQQPQQQQVIQQQILRPQTPRVEIREVYIPQVVAPSAVFKSTGEKWTQVNALGFQQPKTEREEIKVIDNFIQRRLSTPRETIKEVVKQVTVEDRAAIELLDNFIRRLKKITDEWHIIQQKKQQEQIQIKQQKPIVLKETKYVRVPQIIEKPGKVIIKQEKHVPKPQKNDAKANARIKKTITYTYLDNYKPSTRVYTLDDYNNNNVSVQNRISEIPNYITSANLRDTQAEALIAKFSKPFVKTYDEYSTLINTGLKSSDYVQIHPLLTDSTKINKLSQLDARSNYAALPSVIEPVMIDSDSYEKYAQEISKHFGGLKVVDFPIYVQGLELRQQQTTSGSNTSMNNSFVKAGLQSNGSSQFVQQTANDSDNIHFIRVNGVPQSEARAQ